MLSFFSALVCNSHSPHTPLCWPCSYTCTCLFTLHLHLRMTRHVVTIDGYEDVPANDEHALKQAASQQPVAVGICASPAMQFYSGGIIDTCCSDLNHGVLVVGYGTDKESNADYWLVKNSWGGEGRDV